MLSDRLKAETAREHERIEGSLALLMQPELTTASYAGIVARFFGFFRSWETAVAPIFASSGLGPFFDERRKTRILHDDLRALGMDEAQIAALPTCPVDALPPMRSLDDALGSMYVTEGSTLGSQLIAKHLERHLHLSDGVGYAYFRGHGRETMPRWQAFKQVLIDPATPRDEDRVVAAASATFARMQAWMDDRV